VSFLAPLFLLGTLAIAAPILFHLIRRSTREKTPFSSLMFLLPSPPRLTRRNRLEHILLLLLRCLVLCLLALGFSRPFFKKSVPPAAPSAGRRMLILVDTSASMRRANLWGEARNRAESLIRSAAPADQLALYTFDRGIKPLITFEQWNASPVAERTALGLAKLGETSAGWSATMTANALISAAETLVDSRDASVTGSRQIVLVTDLQEGSHLNQLQGYEWPKGIELSVEMIKPKHLSNASLQLVTEADDADPKASANIRVRVSNSANSKREQFKVGWTAPDGRNFLSQPLDVYVPAGQSRIVSLDVSTPNPRPTSLLLQGDEEDFDNTIFVVPPETARYTVIYIGSDSETDPHQPLYFLERAFQDTRRQTVKVIARPPSGLDLSMTNGLFIATDSLPDELARILHDQIATGKTLLFAPRNGAAAPTLSRLLGLDHLTLEEGRPNNYAMLAEIDFRYALFAPFADPRFSDFTKIHFWKYRRLDLATIPGARVLAKFDSGDPALLEVPIGKGRIVILTSGWEPEDSQLALSSKFVPLLYSLLELSAPAAPLPIEFHPGDPIPIGPAQQFFTSPGIFTVNSNRFAVNLDPAESRTAALPTDELERLGAPMTRQSSTISAKPAQVRLQNAELENRQKFWRWLIIATLALLLFETWFAGRTARGMTASAQEAT
jgi:hypothetical protein